MLELITRFSPDLLLQALAYVLIAVLALMAVAERFTYWLLLILVALALYWIEYPVEIVALIVLALVAWRLFWAGVSNRPTRAEPKEAR